MPSEEVTCCLVSAMVLCWWMGAQGWITRKHLSWSRGLQLLAHVCCLVFWLSVSKGMFPKNTTVVDWKIGSYAALLLGCGQEGKVRPRGFPTGWEGRMEIWQGKGEAQEGPHLWLFGLRPASLPAHLHHKELAFLAGLKCRLPKELQPHSPVMAPA